MSTLLLAIFIFLGGTMVVKKKGLIAACMAATFVFMAGAAIGAEKVYDAPEEIVTGSRLAISLEEVPAPTYVITRDQIERSGSRDLATILEQNVPGIYVKQKTGHSNNSQISMRGYVTEVLVLVDGVPYYRSSHGAGAASVDFRDFPISNIERIDVVKGTGSATYGSMAAGGVINIITRKATEGITIEGEVGPNDWRRYFVQGEGAGEKINAGIWYSHKEEGEHRLLEQTEKIYNALDYKENAYGVTLNGKDWNFKSETGEFKNTYETPGWMVPVDINKEKGQYQRHSFRYNGNSYYVLMGYNDQRYYIQQNQDNYYKDRAFTTEFGKRSQWGATLASWGMTYRKEETTYRPSTFDPEINQDRTNYAPFVELSRPFGDVIGTLGLRYEIWRQDNADNYNELMPKMTLQLPLNNNTAWYISAGRFFAMPSMYELHANGPWGTKGNPNLKPEKGWNYDLGIKGANDSGNWGLGIFYSNMKDKIIWRSNTYENMDDFRSYGVEASHKWNLSEKWSFGLSGTWQKAQEKKGNAGNWENSYGLPEWQFMSSLTYHNGPWTTGINCSFVANRSTTPAQKDWTGKLYNPGDDYFQTDIFTEWKSGDHTVRLSCYNLFDEEFTYNSAGWNYYGPERSVYLTWRYSF